MSKTTTISVAVCTYNGEKYLIEQLDSILSQEIAVDEIVVCDDASNDQTWEILEFYKNKFKDIFKIYRNEQTLGISKNFEKSINNCTKEVIFLSDQDDIWHSSKTKKILEYFEAHKNISAVFHDMQLKKDNVILNNSNWDSIFFHPLTFTHLTILDHLLLVGNVVTGSSLVFRKPESPLIFNNNSHLFLHDYQLAVHFAQYHKLGFITDRLGIYRLHDKQQVGTSLENIKIRERIYNLEVYSKPEERLKFYIEAYKTWNRDYFLIDKKLVLNAIKTKIEVAKSNHLKKINFFEKILKKTWWAINSKYFIN